MRGQSVSDGVRARAWQAAISRISDYSKELEFWKDTVRKILLSGGIGKEPAEETLTSVVALLRTYGTQGRAEDSVRVDSILEAARMLTKPENAG